MMATRSTASTTHSMSGRVVPFRVTAIASYQNGMSTTSARPDPFVTAKSSSSRSTYWFAMDA